MPLPSAETETPSPSELPPKAARQKESTATRTTTPPTAQAPYTSSRAAGAGWAQQAYIKASNTGQSDNFGYVVALSDDGNTLAVSAYFEASAATGVNGNQNDDSLPQAGAVYVFTRTAGKWSQQAYLKASNTGRAPNPNDPNDWGDGDQFGFSLALSGDGNTLAAGTPSEDSRASGINNLAFQNDDSSLPPAPCTSLRARAAPGPSRPTSKPPIPTPATCSATPSA